MQAFTDVPVKCCDCRKTFLSASSLLHHFAQHVKINLAKSNYEKFKSVSKKSYLCKGNNHSSSYKKFNNAVENVSLKNIGKQFNINTCSSSPLTSTDSSLQSTISDKSEFNSSVELSESKNPCDDIGSIDENAQQLPTKLLFHEKENNVGKNLVQKNVSKQICVEFDSEKLLINIEKITSNDCRDFNKSLNSELLNNNNNNNNNDDDETEDKSLNFNENYSDMNDSLKKRKNSNRKQLLPKKIERTSNGFIKIAPSPENVTINHDREIQSKKSTNKKKYNCHLCSKVFGWSTDLKRHILVHTGERPYKCTKCSACFTRNFLLQKHKSKIHPCSEELIEKNKLLEEKVYENLKQLKNKMIQFENVHSIKIEITENNEDNDQADNNFDEEMTFDECKLDIKEELPDPLAITPSSPNHEDSYINSNWVLANNNNNNNDEKKFLQANHKEVVTVGPIKIMS